MGHPEQGEPISWKSAFIASANSLAPERVWGALTQQDEIVRWWSDEARVKPEVGSLGEFRFRPPAGVLQFEVAELDEGL